MKFLTVLFLAMVSLFSCRFTNSKVSTADSDSSQGMPPGAQGLPTTQHTGFDIAGDTKSCPMVSANTACTEVFTEGDDFRNQCEAKGFKSMMCGCHSYLCGQKFTYVSTLKPDTGNDVPPIAVGLPVTIHSGFDIKGNSETCPVVSANIACTEVFTEGDDYRSQCEKKGFKSMMCGCHTFLCSQKFDFVSSLKPDIAVGMVVQGPVKGFNSAGTEESCTPMAPGTICTMVFTSEDAFGQSCKEKGFTATQCGCHKFICSENLKK